MAKKLQTTVYLDREAHAKLVALSKRTRISEASYIREGLAWVLKKYDKPQTPKFTGQRDWTDRYGNRELKDDE